MAWWGAIYRDCIPVMHRCTGANYAEHNSVFIKESSASAAPRAFVSHDPAVVHVGIVTLVLGICDAFAAVLPYSTGDNYMLGLLAVLISPTRAVRIFSALCFFYVVGTHPVPHAYGMVRMFSLAFSLVCANIYSPRKYAICRVLVSTVAAIAYCPVACTSLLRAVPPVAMLYAFRGSYSPTAVLIIASLFA